MVKYEMWNPKSEVLSLNCKVWIISDFTVRS